MIDKFTCELCKSNPDRIVHFKNLECLIGEDIMRLTDESHPSFNKEFTDTLKKFNLNWLEYLPSYDGVKND